MTEALSVVAVAVMEVRVLADTPIASTSSTTRKISTYMKSQAHEGGDTKR